MIPELKSLFHFAKAAADWRAIKTSWTSQEIVSREKKLRGGHSSMSKKTENIFLLQLSSRGDIEISTTPVILELIQIRQSRSIFLKENPIKNPNNGERGQKPPWVITVSIVSSTTSLQRWGCPCCFALYLLTIRAPLFMLPPQLLLTDRIMTEPSVLHKAQRKHVYLLSFFCF